MTVFDLFSKRQKKLKGDKSDVYQYDDIPHNLRVQIVHIVTDTVGKSTAYSSSTNEVYGQIHRILCKEYGKFTLKEHAQSDYEAVYDSFLASRDYEYCLDVIELSFKFIDTFVREKTWEFHGLVQQTPDDAIGELNCRFKESCIGYQFESGWIVRIDSQLIHAEAVKPAMQLLGSTKIYAGANDEFLKAHEHYRHKRNKECLVDCLKALESLMKAICDTNKWKYEKTDTAQRLINICLEKQLIPTYLQSQFSSLRSLLESGIPTVRNKEGGHGQGIEISTVPEHLAAYALHLTASNILFLAQCQKNI